MVASPTPPLSSDTLEFIRTAIGARLPHVIALRRDLHAHPQIGYEETYASELVQRELTALGIPFEAGLAKTGVVGWIRGARHGQDVTDAVALRADMDALPITEETGLPYASRYHGVMHACGHDGHTAMLLGAAAVLKQMADRLPRPVKLIFQPAEEGGGGGDGMVRAGALTQQLGGLTVRRIFGLHGYPSMAVGTLTTRPGPIMAATAEFRIALTGLGGHAAMPHTTIDPVPAAAQLIAALQTVVSRNVPATSPAVITVAQLHAGSGTALNVIPTKAELAGTIRYFHAPAFEIIERRMRVLTEQTAAAFGLRVAIDIKNGYPATLNDPTATEAMQAVARQVLGGEQVVAMADPIMGAEDFAYYGPHASAAFAFIGVRPAGQETYPALHTPKFDFTDAALPHGIALHCGFAFGG